MMSPGVTTTMEQSAMYQERATELERTGALYVNYDPRPRSVVAEAMKAWDQFCALPDQEKERFDYTPDHKVSGNGYELKLTGSIDRKEDCHLRVNARDELLKTSALAHPEIGPAFVEAALKANEAIADIVRDFAQIIETEYDVPGFEQDVMEHQPRWLLRFLHYFGDRRPGEEIAAAHPDKGGFTLHLYESHPGVEYFSRETREWTPLPLPHDQTVMFPGLGLQQRTRCRLKALVHRVVATEETGRTSAVCFFNFGNARFYDKQRFGPTQGLIQKHGPGYFYDMPFEEFDQHFID